MKLLEVRRKGVQRPRAIPRTSSSQILNGVRRSGSSGVLGDIFKKVLGEEHPNVATLLNHLASLLKKQAGL